MSKVTITYKEPKVIEFDDITSAQNFIKDKNEKDITIVVPATNDVYDIIGNAKLKEIKQCFITWCVCIVIWIVQIGFSISYGQLMLVFVPPVFICVIAFGILYLRLKYEFKEHIKNTPDFSKKNLTWTCWSYHLEELKQMEEKEG